MRHPLSCQLKMDCRGGDSNTLKKYVMVAGWLGGWVDGGWGGIELIDVAVFVYII